MNKPQPSEMRVGVVLDKKSYREFCALLIKRGEKFTQWVRRKIAEELKTDV